MVPRGGWWVKPFAPRGRGLALRGPRLCAPRQVQANAPKKRVAFCKEPDTEWLRTLTVGQQLTLGATDSALGLPSTIDHLPPHAMGSPHPYALRPPPQPEPLVPCAVPQVPCVLPLLPCVVPLVACVVPLVPCVVPPGREQA